MKRKYLLGLLTLLLCFTLIGCTSKKEEPKKEEKKVIEISQEEQEFIDNKYSTDEKTLVLKQDSSYVVYEIDGETILSSKTYIDYIVPAKAEEEYEKHKDEKYDTVEDFYQDGRYIVYVWAKNQYEDKTVKDVKELYKDLKVVEKTKK